MSEITVEEARKILGKVAQKMTDEQIQDQLAMMQFLVETWVDEYERKVFDGKTLEEMIPGEVIRKSFEKDDPFKKALPQKI